MSCNTLIGQSQSNYKLATALVNALSEHFNFSSDDAWSVVSNRTHEQLAKKFKKQKKKDDPYRSITKPRQAYSFYTKMNYTSVAEQNKGKELGDISKLISSQWKKLGKKEKQRYMDMQNEDKERYTKERAELENTLASAPMVEETTEETPAPVETPKRQRKKVEPTTTDDTTTETTSTKTKKSSKGKKSGKGKKNSGGRKHRKATTA